MWLIMLVVSLLVRGLVDVSLLSTTMAYCFWSSVWFEVEVVVIPLSTKVKGHADEGMVAMCLVREVDRIGNHEADAAADMA